MLKNTDKTMLGSDPVEEIFALNMGEFLTEHLISDELLGKINTSVKDKTQRIKDQLEELISIYSVDQTLNLLGFNGKDEFIVYNSIATTISQMLDVELCQIFMSKTETIDELYLSGSSDGEKELCLKKNNKHLAIKAFKSKENELNKEAAKISLAIPMTSFWGDIGVIYIEKSQKTKKAEIHQKNIELLEVIARLFTVSFKLQELVEETNLLLADPNSSVSEFRHIRAELTAIIGDLGDEQKNFVEALADSVDVKSKYQEHHSLDVANLAKELALNLGLNEKTVDLIYYAGLLHNIGKIVLPQGLFDKNKNLTDEDWKLIQNHPNVGVNLLMRINFLSEVIPYINYHKERWDGKGEPEGLSGMSIPLGSRIISVADAYQAIISERPYRKPISSDEALKIIQSESSIKWDPDVVNALLNVKS